MFTARSKLFDVAPPPSGSDPAGQVTESESWRPARLSTPADWTTEYSLGCLAHTALTTNVVSRPLALLTSPTQRLFSGNELLTFAAVLPETTKTPPPSGTLLAGQVAKPRVWRPAGAVSRPPAPAAPSASAGPGKTLAPAAKAPRIHSPRGYEVI